MSCDLYKKMAIELLAGLSEVENPVICITSSHKAVDTRDCGRQIAEALCLMDLSVNFVDARVDGEEEIIISQPKKLNDKLTQFSFEKKQGQNFTSFSAKSTTEELKTTAKITLLSLDGLTNSAPAMMLGGCCDGIILAERKNLSRTDSIDNTLQTISNLCVKPLGFVLV